MAKKKPMDSEHWRELEAMSAATRALLQSRIDFHQGKLAEEKAAREAAEARRQRRSQRIHRILTLGLGRAA
jgi:hypothetical protein